MTYVDNGPAWWTLLLLAVGGGLIALLARDGFKWGLGWWAAWRRQYRARHRTHPIEDATDDGDPAYKVDDVMGVGDLSRMSVEAFRARQQATPLRWAANGRYVHRANCDHMTTGQPITVWSEDAARKWAESTRPRLTACPHCQPFDTPEPVEAT